MNSILQKGGYLPDTTGSEWQKDKKRLDSFVEERDWYSSLRQTWQVFCHGEFNYNTYIDDPDWKKKCESTDYFYQPDRFEETSTDFYKNQVEGGPCLSFHSGIIGTEQLVGKEADKKFMSCNLLGRTASSICKPDILGKAEKGIYISDAIRSFLKPFFSPPYLRGPNKECKFGDDCTCDTIKPGHNNLKCAAHTRESWRMGVGYFDKALTLSRGWGNRSLRDKLERIWNWTELEAAIIRITGKESDPTPKVKKFGGDAAKYFNLVNYITDTSDPDPSNPVLSASNIGELYPGNQRKGFDERLCKNQIDLLNKKIAKWDELYNEINTKWHDEVGVLQNIRFCKLFYLRIVCKSGSGHDDAIKGDYPNIYLNEIGDGDWSVDNAGLAFNVQGIFGAELMQIFGPGIYAYFNCSPLRIWKDEEEIPEAVSKFTPYEDEFTEYIKYVIALNNIWADIIKKKPVNHPTVQGDCGSCISYKVALEEGTPGPSFFSTYTSKNNPRVDRGKDPSKKNRYSPYGRTRKGGRRKKHKKQTRKHRKNRRKKRTKKRALKKRHFSHKK